MEKLKGSQRTHLKSLAHHLQPTVHIGKDGVSEGLIEAVDQALSAHELIKVRFLEHKSEKKALHQEIARKTRSHSVGMVGHVAILYRRHPDKEKRKIEVPDDGRRTKDDGRRARDDGRRAKDDGRRTKDDGRRAAGSGRRPAGEARKGAGEARRTTGGGRKPTGDARKTTGGVRKAAGGTRKSASQRRPPKGGGRRTGSRGRS